MSRKLLILLSGTIVFLFSISDVASAAELMALINVSDQTMVVKKKRQDALSLESFNWP